LTLYSGLFGSPVDELVDDDAFVTDLLRTEAALSAALADVGLVDRAAADAVAETVAAEGTRWRLDPTALGVAARGGGNLVIPLVGLLREAVRERYSDAVAASIHTGATSQDIHDTATVLMLRAAVDALLDTLDAVVRQLRDLAEAHLETVCVARTLSQQALPTRFGSVVAGWGWALVQARQQLAAVVLPCSLAGAAGTLASVGDRADALVEAFAARTGLPAQEAPWHTMRVPFLRLAAALTETGQAVATVAGNLVLLAQTEVGETWETSDRPDAGSSSAMPHKRNPAGAVLTRAAAQRLIGLASMIMTAPAHEMQRAAGAWHAEWQTLRDMMSAAGGALSRLTETLDGLAVDAAAMRRNVDRTDGLILAERITVALTGALGRGEAQRVVQVASREAVRSGRPLAAVLHGTEVAAGLDLDALLDPAGYTGNALAGGRRLIAGLDAHLATARLSGKDR
jgi:3-carboxy-cis,cis-muconate cycloisomerase